MPCAPNTRLLNVPSILEPILENYDAHVNNFILFLAHRLHSHLVYDGPRDFRDHILLRTTYACSLKHGPTGKLVTGIFPIMLGSRLDLAIRHGRLYAFPDVLPPSPPAPFEEPDIARGFFMISGFVRHLPYSYTNDPLNTHVVKNQRVRVYSYDAYDRGKEMSFYITAGDLVVVNNDGKESREPHFFDHCPYPTDPEKYMEHVYRQNLFEIDSLTNKMVVSPGHLFVKLFVKYLYGPLRMLDQGEPEAMKLVRSKRSLVVKSIESGCLLHVLSRKTTYFKEGRSRGKMTTTPRESHREFGANGEMFTEKSTGCYRDVNMQTYPLNPYLTHLIVRQMSSKVKSVDAVHPSHLGYLCILGCMETKNVGRTSMMVRNLRVSTCNALDPVFHDRANLWSWLKLEPCTRHPKGWVVVNEACVPVQSYRHLDLLALKRAFSDVECYEEFPFVYIRCKVGLVFKQLPGTDVWVTPRDMGYWSKRLLDCDSVKQLAEKVGFDFITSHHTDLNAFFQHNAFPKNVLAFNALKNAVLATDPRYSLYFMDSVSAYVRHLTPYHKAVLEPVDDGVSPHFVLRMPQVTVAYMSFLGCTQEDGIVCRRDVTAFHCSRFYTIRIQTKGRFHPVRGDPDPESHLVGSIVHHEDVKPLSIQVQIVPVSDTEKRIYFNKKPFRVVQHTHRQSMLTICLEQEHASETGDKLCSLHGQKGVMRLMEPLPLLDESVQPDLLVNAYGLFRMTLGQIREGLEWGGGKDAQTVRNSDGKWIPHAKAFYAKTFYFPIAYWSSEHLYAPKQCTMDKILGQPVKGRSRRGGMKIGNMELLNGLRGNGTGACCEEKFFEHTDRTFDSPTIPLPKSIHLVREDARIFKCDLKYKVRPSVIRE